MDGVGLEEMGVDELTTGRSGYWTTWVLDKVGMDELESDKVGMDELAFGRSGCGRSGNRPYIAT